MRALISLIGISMAGFAVALYVADLKSAVCVAMAIVGCGLVADGLRK